VDTKLLFENESYAIRGAYFEVNKSKDHGFFEAVYQGGVEIEFEIRDVPYVSQPKFNLSYRGRLLSSY